MIYDSTFFANAPPAFPGTVGPCIMSDRGSHGVNYRTGPRYTDIDWTKFRAWCKAIPTGSVVCLDIEGMPGQPESEVTYAVVRALRTSRGLRPDCSFGFYAGPAGFSAYHSGDIPRLMEPELTADDKARRSATQVVFQALYPDWTNTKHLNNWTPEEKARLITYRIGAVRCCTRWNVGYTIPKPVYPIITGSLHATAKPTGEYVGDELVLAQLRVVKAIGRGVVWDGAAWSDGTYAGRADYNTTGKRWAWLIENEGKA